MKTPLLTSRFRAIYAGIASLCLISLLVFSFVLTSVIVPKVLQMRVNALDSLVSSQRDALLFNDNRVLRDELLRERVIERDQQFEEIRVESELDRRRLGRLLLQCTWKSEQACVGENYTVIVSEPNQATTPSFVILLKTKFYSSLTGVGAYRSLGSILLVLFFSFGIWTIRRQEKFLLERIKLLVGSFSQIEKSFRLGATDVTGLPSDEFGALALGLERMGDLLEKKAIEISGYRKTIEQKARHEEIVKSVEEMNRIASQVAHDIRSPLAALTVLEMDLSELPEEKRIMLRGAIHRIRDIASDLLNKNGQRKGGLVRTQESGVRKADGPEPLSAELLSTLLSTIATEKRLQYRSRIGIEIEICFGTGSYGLFSDIQSSEFKRVVSNLVDNSIEAIDSEGFVRVRLEGDSQYARIMIEDSGRGISEEILPRLMQQGESHGKLGGLGLGLHHAKTVVESWNGKISISSKLGKGTMVTLLLPRRGYPKWFVPELVMEEPGTKTQILILDDDASIHRIWRNRIESTLRGENHELAIFHFSLAKQFREWIRKAGGSPPAGTENIFLIDYELSESKTGLDLIEELGIQDKAILVTSRFEERSIRERCQRLGVRIIPKPMVAYLPISLTPRSPGLPSSLTETTLSAASPGSADPRPG